MVTFEGPNSLQKAKENVLQTVRDAFADGSAKGLVLDELNSIAQKMINGEVFAEEVMENLPVKLKEFVEESISYNKQAAIDAAAAATPS